MTARDGVPRNPVTRWRNRRAVSRVHEIDVRWLEAEALWKTGKFAEYADILEELAKAYGQETRVIGWLDSVVSARIRRCEALVRSGRPGLAEAEARDIAANLAVLEGPDGPQQRKLRRRMDAAYDGEELPHD
ncbi:hypothetical protein [Actinomadura sp. WMMA1423]|uniref:hypothetical protein n=1 Tax=Actinomadura sp. WMMA1423 TaxID=2591108 RepID=UPI00114747A5|nr:hypothetical protein [Actinomadura sp. WMMA1423]